MSEPNWDYIQACIRFCELEDKILWATCKAARCEETGTFGFRHRVASLKAKSSTLIVAPKEKKSCGHDS